MELLQEIRNHSGARGKYMAHNHGSEYQIRIVHEDRTEELSGLLKSIDQVVQAMTSVNRPQGNTYWLLVRNVLCPDCADKEQIIMECPITNIPSPRYLPHESGNLPVVGSSNRYALGFSPSMHIRYSSQSIPEHPPWNASPERSRHGTWD
jgi:hypothetical protein